VRRLLTTLILLAGVLAPASGPALVFECSVATRCADVDVPHGGHTVPDARVRILLPKSYVTTSSSYPVLYLLHGAGDTYKTWTEKTDVEQFTKDMNLIVVMPDAGHDVNAGWYSDWLGGPQPQWETFHTADLVQFVDTTYRTLGDGHRAIAGLSMGGFGAMSYAVRHAHGDQGGGPLFKDAASFSGAVDTNYAFPLTGIGFTALHDRFGTPSEDVWGNQITNAETWRAHNPTDRAADLAGMNLFIATGTGTPAGAHGDDPANPGGYGIEQFIFQMNVSFARALTLAGVQFEPNFYPGGLHSWPYWEADLHWALPSMLADID
jgi:S-formylglutathione hydrolase FrmB